ncbi:hypothetical protein [Paenibacillus sp. HB172176]|uniref:hypothetical protein n=1 Tax=Paenibacillus sp. HB172176 TaxID=2493690 RepID=UPI0014395D4A|nr:hypothetical protein [Paenibacillus sp. HB172176]
MNIRNQSLQNRILLYAASTIVVLVMAGCQNSANVNADYEVSDNHLPLASEKPQGALNHSSQQTDDEEQSDTDIPDKLNALDKSMSAETSSMRDELTAGSPFSQLDGSAAWNASLPKLSGISMLDTSSSVIAEYGSEKDSYMLGEEPLQVKVLEYEGISIGFDNQNSVQFIEVYSDQIPAGLNGLKIGDSPDDAYSLLGKPDTQTEYLLTYQAEGALLKLDIDPGSNRIISIKLLSAA